MAQDTLLGFPAHTLYPQGVCSIRKAAEPLTAALPYRRGEFTTLSTVSSPEQCSGFFLFRNGNKVDIHGNRKIILNGP